jgi:class I fructose-bisphosphate aldolase
VSLGKTVRLNRIFSHPSGRLCSVAVDHFMIYNLGLPPGLRQVRQTLAAVVQGRPDAVTLHKGIAASLWQPYAGQLPLIIQTSGLRPDDSSLEDFATLEEVVRLGADAAAVVVFARGKTEGFALRRLADYVRESARYEIPIICHIYPRDENLQIVYTPEAIAWAVRCAVEVGADVVKTPYCGDVEAARQIVDDCPVPLIAAGGPKTSTFEGALQLMADAVRSGMRGATIGRNIWGSDDITGALRAFKAVIHDETTPQAAMAHLSALAI